MLPPHDAFAKRLAAFMNEAEGEDLDMIAVMVESDTMRRPMFRFVKHGDTRILSGVEYDEDHGYWVHVMYT
jgi:hypothetical protein